MFLRTLCIAFLFVPLLVSAGNFKAASQEVDKKNFFSWSWQDQIKPTLDASLEEPGLKILGGTLLAMALAKNYEQKVYEHNERGKNLLLRKKDSAFLGALGAGAVGIGIATTQLLWDQENGFKHFRALVLTSLTHVSLSYLVRRERPGSSSTYLPFDDSFPSGHAAAAFTTATSVYYAYGWKAGMPAYLVASSIALARVTENRHWATDVIAGAGIGIFWASASYRAKKDREKDFAWSPVLLNQGLAISALYSY